MGYDIFHDNQHHQECVVILEDSLCTPPTKHLAFVTHTTYITPARPGVQGLMGRNHLADLRA
jgi:hypothetical protein